MVGIRPLSLVFLTLALLLPASASAEPTTQIIVKRDPGLSAADQRDIRADAGVRKVDTLLLPRTDLVTAPADEAQQAVRELNRDPDVVYAQIDHTRSIDATDRTGKQWALNNTGQNATSGSATVFYGGLFDADIDAFEAWNQGITGDQQRVAVVDTGVDDSLSDLNGQISEKRAFINGQNFANMAPDGNSHGTHVTGIIDAISTDNDGISGVAPSAKVMALKALADNGQGADSDIANAMLYAAQQGVRVVNLSLGGSDDAPVLEDAIHQADQTLFVIAAGNEGTNNDDPATPSWPCNSAEPNVICVGASDNRDRVASFSNYGHTTVDLFAPGDMILSTVPAGTFQAAPTATYGYKSGTSMAAPHVAAAAALLLQVDPTFTVQQLEDLILDHVDVVQAFNGKSVTGGRLNVGAAVAFARDETTDSDGDGVIDAIDTCPNPGDGAGGTDGCAIHDTDGDGTLDPNDNCPGTLNASQADDDGDGDGNACDDTPRGPDSDGDGKPALDDSCPNQYGSGSDGCPVHATPTPTPTPIATPTPRPVDSDGDGFYNPSDGCPYEYARTNDGCPVPAVTSLSARAKKRHGKRRATISVRSSRAAMAQITVQVRKCKHGHCRWARVTRKTTATVGGRVKYTTRALKRGKYRVVVVLSSSAGRAAAETQSFRVR